MSDKLGPWWVTSFAWQGSPCVIRFKLAPDGAHGWRPARIELCTSACYEPSRAIKRRAVEQFVRDHHAIIADAYALADSRPPVGPYAAEAAA